MPIQILPPQLANQIAAGEVVERPASVIKELLENSLDAGATKIEIDIEAGGSRLIRIRDNGKGIVKDELALALSRHATSKVATLDDLESIMSLGFRGEALASISSVSRLTLSSRTEDQTEAWQAYAEGLDMDVIIQPSAHPVGTTIEVRDLFFNTPARRRFMRTDKTEFGHVEEVVKRIVLSRFDVQIKLTNNGKLHKLYRIGHDDNSQLKRIAAVCGPSFIDHVIKFDAEYDIVQVNGWLGEPQVARQQRDLQYCYVNGRMMKDKLINHAIRQAYESRIATDQHAAYILFIKIDPKQVDVNVHPAKHEVRFHQSRLVHDFIYKAVYSALNEQILVTALDEAETPTVLSSTVYETEPTRSVEHVAPHRVAANFNADEEVVKKAGTGVEQRSDDLYPGQEAPSLFSRDITSKPSNLNHAQTASLEPHLNLSCTSDMYSARSSTPSSTVESSFNQVRETLLAPKQQVSSQHQIERYAELINPSADSDSIDTEILTLMDDGTLIIKLGGRLLGLESTALQQALLMAKLNFICANADAVAQPLLLPVAFKVDEALVQQWQYAEPLLTRLQIRIQHLRVDTLVIQKVPPVLRPVNLVKIIPNWLMSLPKAPITDNEQQSAILLLIQHILTASNNAHDIDIKQSVADYQHFYQHGYLKQSLTQFVAEMGFNISHHKPV